MKAKEILFLALPIVLWVLVFIVFKAYLVYAMVIATAILAALSLKLHRKEIHWVRSLRDKRVLITIGAATAVALYFAFFAGNLLSDRLGLGSDVSAAYFSIYGGISLIPLVVSLILIGIFEEIYWRGALMGALEKRKGIRKYSWLIAAGYYTSVHVASLNPIIVIAALVIGFAASAVAYKFGVLSSIVMHIVWIEAVTVVFPL
jgi:membrane protease YdiL (CAAX protease family)